LLTLALDGGECSVSCTGHFTSQGKSHQYPLDRRLGGSTAGMDVMARRENPCP